MAAVHLEHTLWAQKEEEVSDCFTHTLCLPRFYAIRHVPAALPPWTETRYPLYRRLGGQVWTGAENLAAPPGFDPWTVQPVESSYTDRYSGIYYRLNTQHIITTISQNTIVDFQATRFGCKTAIVRPK